MLYDLMGEGDPDLGIDAPAPRQPEREEFENLMLLIIGQAAQDAVLRDGGPDSKKPNKYVSERIEAKRWFMSADEHGWEFRPDRGGLTEIKGVSFRWVCRQLDIDPDLAQAEIRRIGWRLWNERCVYMCRAIRRGPETQPRKRPGYQESLRKRFEASPRHDRRAVDVRVASREENAATVIVGAAS